MKSIKYFGKMLQAKINWASERPTRFSAVPFEKVLDLLMEVKKEQQKALEETSEQTLHPGMNETLRI